MSLIALRRGLRRRGRRFVAVAAIALLSALTVAHHGAVSEQHATTDPIAMSMHQVHDLAPVPPGAIDLIEICAAVLPGLLLLALALGGLVVLRPSWIRPLRRPRDVPIASRAHDRRARAGPRVLCVMRC